MIREALHNELGYAVTDKYKQKTHHLLELYKSGADLSTADLDIKESTVNTNRVFKNVDGIKFLNHEGGCGGTRQDSAILSSLLVSYADHPNVAGITLLSLGCQHMAAPDGQDTPELHRHATTHSQHARVEDRRARGHPSSPCSTHLGIALLCQAQAA